MPVKPLTMRAVIQDSYGAPERVLRLDEIPVPPVGADDVLIRVRATSVNTPDWATVAGAPYIMRPGIGLRRPRRPVRGSDIAGVVQAVGQDVTDLAPGDEVFGSTRNHAGAFAQGPDHRVDVSEGRRPGRRAGLYYARRPRVAEHHLPRGERHLAQRSLPAGSAGTQRYLADHGIGHPVQEVVLVAHVRVEGHRLDAQFLREPAHADQLNAVADGELDGSRDHPLPRQLRAAHIARLAQRRDFHITSLA